MESATELFDLTGKVAVVTGGSRGIGRAVAEGLATAGADVVIASRKLDNCQTAAAEIERATGPPGAAGRVPRRNLGGRRPARRHRVRRVRPVRRPGQQRRHVAALPEPRVGHRGALRQDARGERARGPFRLGVLFGQRMFDGDGGSIINVSTAGSLRPGPGDLPYAMAKAGLNALTLGLAGA